MKIMTDITIYVDQKPYSVLEQYRKQGFAELPSIPTLSGAQILALVGRDACYQLFLENPDPHEPDMLIPVWSAVILTDEMVFYGIPPAISAQCPCGNTLIRDGVVVMSHWTGKICQECESAMFEKYADRVAHQHDNEPDEPRFPR